MILKLKFYFGILLGHNGLELFLQFFIKVTIFLIVGAEVVILCYNLNEEATIHNLKWWLSEINKYTN